MSVRFHPWRLGFRQSSFHPIARVLQDDPFSVFQRLPLFRHAPFPSSFHLRVNRMTQKFPSDLLLTASRIQHRVPRRTVSPHTAQAFPRPVTEPGPRSFQKTFAIRGCRRRACFSIERHSSTSHRKDGADAPSRGKPRLSFAFPPANDSSTSLAMKDPSDVGPLSSRVTFKPVSAPLQYGVRFFQHPKPAPPWAHLTARCPEKIRSDTRFPRSTSRSTQG